jgi:uncharacterized protein (TIGR02147 family)
MVQLLAYQDYRAYLADALDAADAGKKGARTRLATAMGCQISYLSQVLKGLANLNLEQAERANEFFGHTDEAAEYFFLIVNLGRAGTERLRQELKRQAARHQERFKSLHHRVKTKHPFTPAQKRVYYRSWHYAAVAIALTVPRLRQRAALADELRLQPKRVQEVLDFLVDAGIAVAHKDEYRPGTSYMHLSNDEDLTARNQINWRIRAMESIPTANPSDLHYSAVLSLSATDFRKVKDKLVSAIEDVLKVVKASPEEKVACLSLDFFSLGGS